MKSGIVTKTLADKIINLKKANNTSLLHIPSEAVESVILIDQYNYANTITKFEMKAFVKGIQGLELDISNDNFANSITINSQKITLISVSYIISATASDVLIANNDIYIPESAFDSSNNMIKKEELYKFLTAINTGMGITSTAINASQITPNAILDADSLVDSIIMRATITALCSSDEANVYVDTDNIEVLLRKSKTIIDNNQTVYINVLSSNEIKALLDIIGNSTSFELDITLSEILALSDSDIEIYMSSIIFRIKVSKLLIDNGYKNMLVAQSSISITVGGSVETYNLVLTSTPNVYKFISPTNVLCYDIMSVGQTTTSVEILTVRDILAYKTYISSIM